MKNSMRTIKNRMRLQEEENIINKMRSVHMKVNLEQHENTQGTYIYIYERTQ